MYDGELLYVHIYMVHERTCMIVSYCMYTYIWSTNAHVWLWVTVCTHIYGPRMHMYDGELLYVHIYMVHERTCMIVSYCMYMYWFRINRVCECACVCACVIVIRLFYWKYIKLLALLSIIIGLLLCYRYTCSCIYWRSLDYIIFIHLPQYITYHHLCLPVSHRFILAWGNFFFVPLGQGFIKDFLLGGGGIFCDAATRDA